MSSITTQTTIANRALQILGYQPINTINDNSRGSRAINRAYYPVLYKTLRDNFWNFSINRATLPASTTAPAFGRAFYYNLPPDYLILAMPDGATSVGYGSYNMVPGSSSGMGYRDWQIENNNGTTAIASNDQSPLYLRYVSKNVTEAQFDPAFAEAFSANLAIATCEELTQSNTKLQDCGKIYQAAIEDAKKRNAFESAPVRPPVDTYILCRM